MLCFWSFFIYIAQISFLTTWKSSFSIIIYKKRNILKVYHAQMDGPSHGRTDRYTLVDVRTIVKVSVRILISYNCFFYVTNVPKFFNCESNSLLFHTFLTHYAEGFYQKLGSIFLAVNKNQQNLSKVLIILQWQFGQSWGLESLCFRFENKLYLQAKKVLK